jgi:hypothetical protein
LAPAGIPADNDVSIEQLQRAVECLQHAPAKYLETVEATGAYA